MSNQTTQDTPAAAGSFAEQAVDFALDGDPAREAAEYDYNVQADYFQEAYSAHLDMLAEQEADRQQAEWDAHVMRGYPLEVVNAELQTLTNTH